MNYFWSLGFLLLISGCIENPLDAGESSVVNSPAFNTPNFELPPVIEWDNPVVELSVAQAVVLTPVSERVNSCAVSPDLPAGLSLHASTCVISGTPSVTLASTNFTITATNSVGDGNAVVNLSIGASAPSLSYVASSGSVGVALNVAPQTLQSNGAAISSCAVSPDLPAGLSLHASTCVISGKPSVTLVSTNFTITATNSAGSGNAVVNLSIGASAPSLSYVASSGSVGVALNVAPQTLQSNGAAISSCAVSPDLPAGLSLHASTCVISGTPSVTLASTNFTVTATNSAGSGEAVVSLSIGASAPSLSYVASSGSVGVALNVAPQTLQSNGAAISSCAVSPDLPAGLSLHASTCVISGTPSVTLASTNFTVTATNSAGSGEAVVSLSIGASAPSLSYVASSGSVGVALNVAPQTLQSNGAALSSCSVSPHLPAGLSLHASTCVISGTPSVTLASTNFTITATNSAGSGSAGLSLSIEASAPEIEYETKHPFSGTVGVHFEIKPSTIRSNGAEITCSTEPKLPDGLFIDESTCMISGSPDAIQGYSEYTVTATNSAGASTAVIPISLICPSGYIPVHHDKDVHTTQDFCVAKYEMKKSKSNTAVSVPEDLPWVNINLEEAREACISSDEEIEGFDLITNEQWMTIARNIENTDKNWSDQRVGSGILARGHSNNLPPSLLEASADDDDGYYMKGKVGPDDWHQLRTHFLSNNQVIWDFAGNASELINWDIQHSDKMFNSNNCKPDYTDFPASNVTIPLPSLNCRTGPNDVMNPSTWAPKLLDFDKFGIPDPSSSTNDMGLGRYRLSAASGAVSVIRSGHLNGGNLLSGIYYMSFQSNRNTLTGFRCVFNLSTK
jgi:hypothetical protein